MKRCFANQHTLLLLCLVALVPAVRAGSPALSGIVAEANNAESVFSTPAGMSRLA